jgi:hypothetical protein
MGVHSAGPTNVYEMLSGQADPRDPPGVLALVNPAESPPTGWGAFNLQPYQSGHTNNLVTNPSAEQGAGVGPERVWGHYPHATNPNPFRRFNVTLRDGGDAYSPDVYRPRAVVYWANALRYEEAAVPVKVRQGPPAVVNQAPSQPYVATVPPRTPGGY